ncbi:MAG: hypothetical protein NZ870_02415, partial [bacterium]|nr:hypothetical protein [bacterium]
MISFEVAFDMTLNWKDSSTKNMLKIVSNFYPLAKLCEKYKNTKFYFVLSPATFKIEQDIYIHLSTKSVSSLTLKEKEFILRNFFNEYVDYYPEYKKLLVKRGGGSDKAILNAIDRFSDQDFINLITWFYLSNLDGYKSIDFIMELFLKENFSEEDKLRVVNFVIKYSNYFIELLKKLTNVNFVFSGYVKFPFKVEHDTSGYFYTQNALLSYNELKNFIKLSGFYPPFGIKNKNANIKFHVFDFVPVEARFGILNNILDKKAIFIFDALEYYKNKEFFEVLVDYASRSIGKVEVTYEVEDIEIDSDVIRALYYILEDSLDYEELKKNLKFCEYAFNKDEFFHGLKKHRVLYPPYIIPKGFINPKIDGLYSDVEWLNSGEVYVDNEHISRIKFGYDLNNIYTFVEFRKALVGSFNVIIDGVEFSHFSSTYVYRDRVLEFSLPVFSKNFKIKYVLKTDSKIYELPRDFITLSIVKMPEVIFNYTDATADDNGDGSIEYPLNPIFKKGIFDVKAIRIYYDNKYRFEVEFEKLENILRARNGF